MVDLLLHIPDNFYCEEIRCEYKVSVSLKKVWAVELDLLNEFLKFCSENDIKVIVWAGTLLGAVRHKGFILWDDDVDVAMDRENFEKLLRISNERQFEHPYFLQTAYSDRKYFFGYARFRNSETTEHIKGYDSQDYNNGIYIDVFVLDGYGKTEKEHRIILFVIFYFSGTNHIVDEKINFLILMIDMNTDKREKMFIIMVIVSF